MKSQEWKELFRWNKKKTFFIVFEGLSFEEKIKIWHKIADTSFKLIFNSFKIKSSFSYKDPIPDD